MIPKLEQIARLKQNLQTLVIKYRGLVEDKQNLEGELSEVKNELEKLKKDHQEIELQYKKLKLAKNLTESLGGSNEAKQKVNRIVREIDRCIALLNR